MTLKTLKRNRNTTSKDVLLHQIFDEISEEYKEVNGDGYLDEIIPLPQQELSKMRNIQAIRQWFFIALLSTAIIYVLFDTGPEESKTEEQKVTQNNHTLPKINQIIKKDLEAIPVPTVALIETIDTPKIPAKDMPTLKIEEIPQKVIPIAEPQTAREKAKALLRLQLES